MMVEDWKLKIGNWRLTIEFGKASVCWPPIRQFPIFNFHFSISNASREEASRCP